MAEAHDPHRARRKALVAALEAERRSAASFPLNDLPNDLLVSVFAAAEDPVWVRHTFPLVCKAWNELYCSKDASPLHETLEVNFEKEVQRAAAVAAIRHHRQETERARERARAREREEDESEEDEEEELTPRHSVFRHVVHGPFVHGSRVISWAERRAGSVRKLSITRALYGATKHFSFEDMGRLVAVAAPFLTDITFDFDLYVRSQALREQWRVRGHYVLPDLGPFWKAVRDSVAPAGRLRSLQVRGSDFFQSELEPLGQQLAGSLEELVLDTRGASPLSRFPESFLALAKLRRLALVGFLGIGAVPAGISSLEKLEELDLRRCGLSSLPKELGELSGLTKLDLGGNEHLGNSLPADEAFPAALGRMKSLRELDLHGCRLRAVPAFVGGLASLESLGLSENVVLGNTPEDEAFPAALGRMKSLQRLDLRNCDLRSVPAFVGGLASLESLNVSRNENLGAAPQHRAFPAALGKIKSLRDVNLEGCGLQAVPAFVGELASLEVLNLSENTKLKDAPQDKAFPAALGKLKSLRHLILRRCDLRAVPAFIAELESLEVLDLAVNISLGLAPFPAALQKMKSLRVLYLQNCGLRAVPAFIGELESLESLEVLALTLNESLGFTPQDKAFPAALDKMKSLRKLSLGVCGLRTFPAFAVELESLEVLDLGLNDFGVDAAALDALLERCRRLRKVDLSQCARPWTAEQLATLEAFKAKLLAKNPEAEVKHEYLV